MQANDRRVPPPTDVADVERQLRNALQAWLSVRPAPPGFHRRAATCAGRGLQRRASIQVSMRPMLVVPGREVPEFPEHCPTGQRREDPPETFLFHRAG